jgi:hypothetical protein
MKNIWFKKDPGLLAGLKAEVSSAYPNLHFYVENDLVFIRGTFPILHDGKILDRYSVEILLVHDYPESIPIVREIGGRIPRAPDYHMNPGGDACLFLPDERWAVYPAGTSFIDFLKGPVHNFFLGQALVQTDQPWPFGQHGHGANGIRDYYSKLLGTEDPIAILKYLGYLSKPCLKGHWDCPCGSGRRLRNCHLNMLNDLRTKIPQHIASHSRDKLAEALLQEFQKRPNQ